MLNKYYVKELFLAVKLACICSIITIANVLFKFVFYSIKMMFTVIHLLISYFV